MLNHIDIIDSSKFLEYINMSIDQYIKKFACVIDTGLTKLTSWQVGSPTANWFIRRRPTQNPYAMGGIQNHAFESLLRIDVTQHQMHAVILARRYVYN